VGERGADGRHGRDGVDGKHGVDGLGFDDIEVTHDGERGFIFTFVRGETRKTFGAFIVPAMIYRGVFADGTEYQRGDVVTWGGSMWHAKEVTSAKPGEAAPASRAWTLAVKAGRDGKAGAPGKDGINGKDGKSLGPGAWRQ
jgi:integrin beta 3